MRNWDDFFTYIKTNLGFTPNTVVDIGVATDTNDLYKHFPNANYLFVEPLEEFEPNLKYLCQKYKGNYALAAAGATNEEITIKVTKDLGGSSRFETREHQDGFYTMKDRKVPQVTLDSLWEKCNLRGPAFLKIDVQGGELEVIKGAKDCLSNFEFIKLEVGVIEQYVGQPIFNEYISVMAENGFVLFDIITCHFAMTGMLAQLDLVFAKKDGIYRSNQRWFDNVDQSNRYIPDHYNGVVRNDNLI